MKTDGQSKQLTNSVRHWAPAENWQRYHGKPRACTTTTAGDTASVWSLAELYDGPEADLLGTTNPYFFSQYQAISVDNALNETPETLKTLIANQPRGGPIMVLGFSTARSTRGSHMR